RQRDARTGKLRVMSTDAAVLEHPATAYPPHFAHPFVQQLRAFQQRLLQIDARNPSVFTAKVVRRRNFDLTTLGDKVAEKAFSHVIAGSGRQRLIDEQGLSPEVVK